MASEKPEEYAPPQGPPPSYQAQELPAQPVVQAPPQAHYESNFATLPQTEYGPPQGYYNQGNPGYYGQQPGYYGQPQPGMYYAQPAPGQYYDSRGPGGYSTAEEGCFGALCGLLTCFCCLDFII